MSTNRDNLRRLSGLIASGKDGYVNAINEFSREYKADSSIQPTEWLDLSTKQIVVHFGAYLVAHKGFNAEQVYGYANVIGANSDKLDLSADNKAIMSQLSALEVAMEKDNLSTANTNLTLGKTQEKLAKGLLDDAKALSALAKAPTLNKSWMLYVQTTIEQLEALLPAVEVAQS